MWIHGDRVLVGPKKDPADQLGWDSVERISRWGLVADVTERLAEVEADRARLREEVNDLRSQLARRFSDPTAPANFARLLMDSTADAATTERELRRIYYTDPVVHALVSYGRLSAAAPTPEEGSAPTPPKLMHVDVIEQDWHGAKTRRIASYRCDSDYGPVATDPHPIAECPFGVWPDVADELPMKVMSAAPTPEEGSRLASPG